MSTTPPRRVRPPVAAPPPRRRLREAAERLGIDRGHLSRIERGLRCPRPEVAERIAELYRLPIAISDRLMAAAALTRAYGRSVGIR